MNAGANDDGKGALIFLLDSKYLIGLKTFAYTLRAALSAWKGDIIILSNDPKLAEDAFVQRFATRVLILSGEDVARLRTVKSDAIPDQYKVADIGAYTSLKFYSLNDFGYDFQIFLDVDMLCMSPNFRFDELSGEYDFAVARELGRGALRQKATEDLPADQRIEALAKRLNGIAEKRWPARKGINSGVFFAAKRILGEEAVSKTIEMASTTAYTFEQDVVKDYVCAIPDLRFRSLPIWYNFLERPMRSLGQEKFREFLPRIKIIHYNKYPKPWQVEEGQGPWWHDFWWQAHHEAQPWIEARTRGEDLPAAE